MQQYNSIKAKYPDAVLLFRVGDFYETFGEDAVRASKILGIVLTKRSNGSASEVELAGFPHHSLDTYLPKLVRAGLRVAVCDQLEDPKLTKTIVKRGVTDLVTPGVAFSEKMLDARSNNYLACAVPGKEYGLALADVSTGDFMVFRGTADEAARLLDAMTPREILLSKKDTKLPQFQPSPERFISPQEPWVFEADYTDELLRRHFEVDSLRGFDLDKGQPETVAAGVILHYLKETQNDRLKHLTQLRRHRPEGFMWLDRFSLRNLEVLQSTSPGGLALVDVVDRTLTPMGARLLKSWLAFPLLHIEAIVHRHQSVEEFVKHPEALDHVRTALEGVHDPERLLAKLAKGIVGPRELFQLAEAQRIAEELADDLQQHSLAAGGLTERVRRLPAWRQHMAHTLADELPVSLSKGGYIRAGVVPELDELRAMQRDGKQYLLDLQQREADATGISSLKVAYNNVFGYYLEVRNTHKDKVPDHWVRKQTLTGAERYITQELKTYEEKILGAEGRIQTLEEETYRALLAQSIEHLVDLQHNARLLAQADVLAGFAVLARERSYHRPQFHAARHVAIRQGRHPVIEHVLPPGEAYVANDLDLTDDQRIRMITGPNMSGKSAYLRQNALISILAQAGCFVPADAADLPVLDRIFVRVGASDNLSRGESTFMVEMTEAAQILNNLTPGSLVILDEIGRGTATYDGVSIAWAIAEYLHEHPAQPLALFATHYHELNEMEQQFKGMANYHVAVQENTDKVIFLRTIQPGGSAHSFGIHVARMAGLPKLVIHRAERMLKHLEKINSASAQPAGKGSNDLQLSFFQMDDPLLAEIKEEITGLDINALTPVEALMLLHQMKKRLGES